MEVGDKVDKLTLMEFVPERIKGHRSAIFKCDCGDTLTRTVYSVQRAGMSPKSCVKCRGKRKKTGGNKKISYGFDNWAARAFITGKL